MGPGEMGVVQRFLLDTVCCWIKQVGVTQDWPTRVPIRYQEPGVGENALSGAHGLRVGRDWRALMNGAESGVWVLGAGAVAPTASSAWPCVMLAVVHLLLPYRQSPGRTPVDACVLYGAVEM